jgi:acetoacetate decarboxylase
MKIEDVRRNAYSMPLTSPAFPPGPYRFFNREYFIITYRTDPEALAAVVPEPLQVTEPVVKYEFIRMPDSTGFGDYTETGQVIPVRLNGEEGAYTHAMYLDDEGPIAGGRELWGFPKKLAKPKVEVESDVLVDTLHYGSVLCASATMGYKHRPVDHDTVLKGMKAPNFILKIIPHVDGSVRICELVRFHLQDITLKEARTGPAALGLFPHALADVARLTVREVISARHFRADDAGLRRRGVRLYGEVMSGSYSVMPAHAGHPVRRGISLFRSGLSNTGSPAFAGDDGGVFGRALGLTAPARS